MSKKFLLTSLTLVFLLTISLVVIKNLNIIIQKPPISPNQSNNDLKTYQNKSLNISFAYPKAYFLEESKTDSGTSINIYSQKPKKELANLLRQNPILGFENRVFHILVHSEIDQVRLTSYLDTPAEMNKLVVNDTSWTVFNIKDKDLGEFKVDKLLVLITIKSNNQYEVNIDSAEMSSIQKEILQSIRFN